MNPLRSRLSAASLLLVSAVFVSAALPAGAQAAKPSSSAPNAKAGASMHDASGTFEVKLASTGHNPDATIESRSIDKTFTGALEATSHGEMLSSGDPASGNAGYVAIERVTGRLDGRVGSFALMHLATMSTGVAPQLQVTVVPGSGTGDLSGIYGTMTIAVAASGAHSYTFRYAFATK